MIDNNSTNKVNALLSKALFISTIALIILLLSVPLRIYDFSRRILEILVFAGLPATILPIILYRLKVSDSFLKYYMLISTSILIGLLGTQAGIGVYIMYVFVPIASGLYLNRKFTLRITSICYVIMASALYFNTANRFETINMGKPHMVVYRDYLLGLSIEYAIVMILAEILVSRAQHFLEVQREALRVQEIENDKQKRITAFYENALIGQRTTVFEAISARMDKFSAEDYAKMASGHRFNSTIQDMLKASSNEDFAINNALATIGEYMNLTRILYIGPENEHKNRLYYDWAISDKYRINSFYPFFSPEDAMKISAEYDEIGFIQFVPNDPESVALFNKLDCGLTRYIKSIAIGTQIWIPTLSGGSYNGAMCFEKNDSMPFPPSDILLLSDLVTTLSMYAISVSAKRANLAKSAFLSSMSHEIRTPMNAILGMTEVSLREDMSPELRNNLTIIKSSAEGLLAIINDILDFSKIESGHMEVIASDYTVTSLINDVKTIANARNLEKGLKITFNVPDDMPSKLHGDMVRIKQVMVNLITNAIKYTDKGSVTIDFSYEKVADYDILLKFSVTDTGQGIRKEDKEKLFMSFSQVNQKYNHHKEGTGLGLAISRQLIELMGGNIDVESTFGEGSTFHFEVPQLIIDASPITGPQEAVHKESSNSPEEIFSLAGKKILVVDDNEINRLVAESLLEIFEMDIDLADGGKEAIELCQKNRYDIIFMDHLMPEMDGVETTIAIRNDLNNPNCKTIIVALTADAMTGVKEKMLFAGMDDFLSKPIDMAKCTAVLKKYLL